MWLRKAGLGLDRIGARGKLASSLGARLEASWSSGNGSERAPRTAALCYTVGMKTQEELRREFDRLKEAEDYEAAGRVLDLIEPISREELRRIFDEAQEVDETLPEHIRQRIEQFHGGARDARRVG